MKAYIKKKLRKSKDPDRMTKTVAIVAAYKAIEEIIGKNERLQARAITDTGATLYALVPLHIAQQYVEKWHTLQECVEVAQKKPTAQELETWHDEAEQKHVHPPRK